MLQRSRMARHLCAVAVLAFTPLSGNPALAAEVVTHWTMPVIPLPVAERPVGPDVFGTIALPVRPRPTSTRWSKVMRASLDQPALDQLTAEARALPPEQGLAFVQAAVSSAIRSQAGPNNCSDDGYWAPAQETLARGMGDCFDVAIAKMEALRLLGIPDRDLYLTSGWFRNAATIGKGRESVALLVRLGDQFWLLPERTAEAVRSGDHPDSADEFTPVVTYGVGVTWIHGKVVQVASLARPTSAGGSSLPATGTSR